MPQTSTPDAHPKPGHNPGYPEEQPHDRGDARQPYPRKPPNPDEGGLAREPETTPEPGSDRA